MSNAIPSREEDGPRGSRFYKVLVLMRTAPHEGEREAAKKAAQRMAERFGMSFEDAVNEALGREQGLNEKIGSEKKDKFGKKDVSAWGNVYGGVHDAAERSRVEMARREAERRAAANGTKDSDVPPSASEKKADGKQPGNRSYYTSYKASDADKVRSIRGLLKEKVPIQRICDLLNVSRQEVTRVYMLNRGR